MVTVMDYARDSNIPFAYRFCDLQHAFFELEVDFGALLASAGICRVVSYRLNERERSFDVHLNDLPPLDEGERAIIWKAGFTRFALYHKGVCMTYTSDGEIKTQKLNTPSF